LRQIGTLPEEPAARHLADHLLSRGIDARLRSEDGGWGVWVLDENRLTEANEEFAAFRDNPDDPRFTDARAAAEQVRRESERLEKTYRKNLRSLGDSWSRPGFRRRPLTIGLIAACVAVYLLLHWSGVGARVFVALSFSSVPLRPMPGPLPANLTGLEDIVHGEVWRLVTPIFMHFDPIHLLFDLWALSAFGSMIEYRRGTRLLAGLVLFGAVASNLGQHLFNMATAGHPVPFGGMSGVVYALFGYAWMKGRLEPQEGMILHPSSVRIMLFWLLICIAGFQRNVANAAHVVGLAAGIVCGLSGL
jgi:GlpG protein